MSLATRSRREFLKTGSLAALAAVLAPHMVLAEEADVKAAIEKLYAGKSMAAGKIKLDLPQIAENGLVVPIGIDIESPMTDADYVKAVHVFADGNPLPVVLSYRFTPDCGKASASARMRLARTQNIVAIAEMSNGSLFTAKQEVKVTIGGCGG